MRRRGEKRRRKKNKKFQSKKYIYSAGERAPRARRERICDASRTRNAISYVPGHIARALSSFSTTSEGDRGRAPMATFGGNDMPKPKIWGTTKTKRDLRNYHALVVSAPPDDRAHPAGPDPSVCMCICMCVCIYMYTHSYMATHTCLRGGTQPSTSPGFSPLCRPNLAPGSRDVAAAPAPRPTGPAGVSVSESEDRVQGLCPCMIVAEERERESCPRMRSRSRPWEGVRRWGSGSGSSSRGGGR